MDVETQNIEIDLRKQLQREFIRRCKKNPNYSMRAFAAYLEVDQSFLSKIFNGKRSVTPALEKRFLPRLGFLAEGKIKKKDHTSGHFFDLEETEYEVISAWYHFAILELLKTKGFKANPSNVAKKLGIHPEEVKCAVDRLAKLGFIKITEKSWVLVSKNHTWIKSDNTTAARTNMQIDLAKRSVDSLENIPFGEREHASLCVAIDSRRLPEFKKRIAEVIMEMSDVLQPDQKNLDSVYQLTIALFPLTKLPSKGESL